VVEFLDTMRVMRRILWAGEFGVHLRRKEDFDGIVHTTTSSMEASEK